MYGVKFNRSPSAKSSDGINANSSRAYDKDASYIAIPSVLINSSGDGTMARFLVAVSHTTGEDSESSGEE
jgi:hypothetical protein